jgi:hypothetical protein
MVDFYAGLANNKIITSKEVRHEKTKMGSGSVPIVGSLLDGVKHDAIFRRRGKRLVLSYDAPLSRRGPIWSVEGRARRMLLQ